jgi:KDO2-lipid IV(A) lauroyltransferase
MFSIFHNSKYKRLIAFLGDQRPPISQHSYLVSFMNHKMIIDDTLARIAKIKHCPLIYIHTLISNNRYIYNPEIIFLPQQNLHLHDITYKYWEALYYDISQNPSYWLWSHKRFISTLNQKFSNQ